MVRLFLRSVAATGERCNSAARSAAYNPEGYAGIASLGLAPVQHLESPVLRCALGLDPTFLGGVRITAVNPLGPCSTALRPDDVLVSVGGMPVGQGK